MCFDIRFNKQLNIYKNNRHQLVLYRSKTAAVATHHVQDHLFFDIDQQGDALILNR
jgi:hypothetical protein